MHTLEIAPLYHEPTVTVQVPDMQDCLAYLGAQDPSLLIDLWDMQDCLGARLFRAANPHISHVSWGVLGGNVQTSALAHEVYVMFAASDHLYNFMYWLFYDQQGLGKQLHATGLFDFGDDARISLGELTALALAFQRGADAELGRLIASVYARISRAREASAAVAAVAAAERATHAPCETITI